MSSDVPQPPTPESQLALRLLPKVGAHIAQYRQERYERRAQDFAGVAFAGLTEGFVEAALLTNERVADDLDVAVEAAARSSDSEKVRLLGRVYRAELTAPDEAQVDAQSELLKVAAQLEPVDIRLLAHLNNQHGGFGRRRRSSAFYRVESGGRPTVAPLHGATRLGISPVVAHASSARLQQHGLVSREVFLPPQEAQSRISNTHSTEQPDVEDSWALTALAQALIEHFESEVDPGESD